VLHSNDRLCNDSSTFPDTLTNSNRLHFRHCSSEFDHSPFFTPSNCRKSIFSDSHQTEMVTRTLPTETSAQRNMYFKYSFQVNCDLNRPFCSTHAKKISCQVRPCHSQLFVPLPIGTIRLFAVTTENQIIASSDACTVGFNSRFVLHSYDTHTGSLIDFEIIARGNIQKRSVRCDRLLSMRAIAAV
jgi:hypothetical protein